MNNLSLYGWNDDLLQLKQSLPTNNHSHGRVTVTHKTCYEVISEEGTFLCELTGNMLYGRSPSDYPCTGDWVIIQPVDTDRGIIIDIIPRKKTLYRRKTSASSEKQPIASYVDKAFIVQSLDESYNVRRVERFMLQILDEGIQPVLVLTKSDLGFDEEKINHSLKHLVHQMPVFISSISQPEKIKQIRNYINPGETVVFTGLSGAGKSSLINALCGQEILQTSTISESTGKGRHTSTRREMLLLEGSGVLIDTPGIKLFGVTNDNDQALSEVLNISDLERSCRFSDCKHINESGCAVIEAVENGTIDREVYESYQKLRREAWHYSASVHEKRKWEKSFTKLVKEVKNHKG